MEIDLKRLPRLWYENRAGERWIPPDDYEPGGDTPEGFCYQVSAFPLELTTTYLKLKSEGGSKEVARGSSGCSDDLVTAMVREWRDHNGVVRQLTVDEAIRIVGNACERCMNSLAHVYGLPWGYPEGGEEWEKARTECQLCKPELVTYV